MINPTVRDFYSKGADIGYRDAYELSHGPRLDSLVTRYDLRSLRGRVLDVGGGLGFLGKRLHEDVDYWVIDGAEVPKEQRLCKGHWIQKDLDHDAFGTDLWQEQTSWVGYGGSGGFMCQQAPAGTFDAAFFLETIEHIGNPHFAIEQIKRLVKPDGDIWVSIPTETVTHNAPYATLLWPENPNFRLFLQQMALPLIDFFHYKPATVGWPAYTYRCRNAAWTEDPQRLLFPKAESKFLGATPLEATNL